MTTISNKLWAEGRWYSSDKNDEIIDAIMNYQEASETDDNSCIIYLATVHGTMLFMVYCQPLEKPDVFKSFYDIPFMMNVIPGGLTTVSEVMHGIDRTLTQIPLA